jgi:hypothetical protein
MAYIGNPSDTGDPSGDAPPKRPDNAPDSPPAIAMQRSWRLNQQMLIYIHKLSMIRLPWLFCSCCYTCMSHAQDKTTICIMKYLHVCLCICTKHCHITEHPLNYSLYLASWICSGFMVVSFTQSAEAMPGGQHRGLLRGFLSPQGANCKLS